MTHKVEDDAIISGIGISDVGRHLQIDGLTLTQNAALQAIADAGLSVSDIDGIATIGDTPKEDVARSMGIDMKYQGGNVTDGGLLSPFLSAVHAVSEGLAKHVLVYRTVLMIGGSVLKNGDKKKEKSRLVPAMDGMMKDIPNQMLYHGYAATNWLGMHCQRHMHLYGTTREQLGWLAISSREKAALNPLAAYQDPITMDDYLNARMVSSPFGLLDCDVPVSGSIAMVISHKSHTADCPSQPLRVEAMGGADGSDSWFDRDDWPSMASVDAANQMWRRTDLKPSDIDIAQLYDGFTYITLAWLEALGFCKTGEGGPFIEGGKRIALDGELPLNTYGGQLSAGRMHGYWILYEACLQLRGHAGQRQVKKHQTAVVAAGGGPIAGSVVLTV